MGLRRAEAVWSQSSARDTGCSRMVQSSGCRSLKPGKSAALLAYTTQRPMSLNMKLCLKLLLRKTWLFPLQFRYELSYTYWAQLGFTKVTSYTYDNSTTNKRTAINTPATDQNQCRRTSIYERSVISVSHSTRRKREPHTFLQHSMQIITIQRPYRDDMPTSPKRSTYLDIQTLPTLCLKNGYT